MKKRFVKKIIGGRAFRALQKCKGIKVGDLITTCNGYNEKIAAIEERVTYYLGHKFVFDLDIIKEDTYSCSLRHCCVYPARTKEQILDRARAYLDNPDMVAMAKQFGWKLHLALLDGKDPLNEDGTLKADETKK